jgi:acetyl/propionyl-CoA carboxylase alpha subunit
MYKITINEGTEFSGATGPDGSYTLDNVQVVPDIAEIKKGIFNVIIDNRSYNAEIIKHDATEKCFHIKVNNNIYKIQVRDRYDDLLKELGMDTQKSRKVSSLKAPMPGLVVEVAVSEGQSVKKGDRIVVLEAMKMENILKSPDDAVIKKISVIKGKTVEKNEVMVTFS